MSTNQGSTRRRFLSGAGAALSAPLAATAALASTAAPADDLATRLARLEDVNAIRAVQREYARLVNAGAHAQAARLFATPSAAAIDASVRRLAADLFAADERIDVAPDGTVATSRLECSVEIAPAMTGGYTLIDMLREQGDGALRSVTHGVLESHYVKHDGAWRIARFALLPV